MNMTMFYIEYLLFENWGLRRWSVLLRTIALIVMDSELKSIVVDPVNRVLGHPLDSAA